jgi:hypothetical protein
MKQGTLILTICIVLISILISGCTNITDESEKAQIKFYDMPLQNISLTENDFSNDFMKMGEDNTTEPSTAENITGNGLSWTILERYDVTFYANVTNGVMESILKLDSGNAAYNLTVLSKDNLLDSNYTLQTIDPIGDICFLLNSTIDYIDYQAQYYMLLFAKGNIFVALGGSASEQSLFVDYAKIIDNNIDTFQQD